MIDLLDSVLGHVIVGVVVALVRMRVRELVVGSSGLSLRGRVHEATHGLRGERLHTSQCSVHRFLFIN